ncbi:hypothetical protein JL720_6665 [Aureococcus anophagefferens]|nr:hypothetical protein JL720_6665 [Aureococcus anophagefferens]
MGAPVAMHEYIMTAPDDWPLDYSDEFCDVVVLDPTYSGERQVRCSTTGACLRRDGRMSERNLVMHLKNISWKKGCNYRGCKRKLGAVVKEGPGRAATKMVRGMAEWEADLAGNRFHKDADGNVRWSNLNRNAHLGDKYPSSVVCGFHARLKTQRSGDTAVRFADDVNRRVLPEDASQVDRAHADAVTEQAREAKRGPIIRGCGARPRTDAADAEPAALDGDLERVDAVAAEDTSTPNVWPISKRVSTSGPTAGFSDAVAKHSALSTSK